MSQGHDEGNSALALLQRVTERLRAEWARDDPRLPNGLVAIVVERAWVPGAEEIDSPLVLIQDGERTFHIADGRELAMLAEASPKFARWAVSRRPDD
jgi:hypothetical protein